MATSSLKTVSWRSPFFDHKPDRIEGIDWFPVDTEALKRVLDEKLLESGAHALYYASFVECKREDRRVVSARIALPSGLTDFTADVWIDCTGNACLSYAAGCEIEYGDNGGNVQSGTLCFKIANFDEDRFMNYAREVGETGNLSVACARAISDGNFIPGETKVSGIALVSPGVAALNFGHAYQLRPLDAEAMTKAEIESRKQLPRLLRFLREYVPGAENAQLVISGPELGVRESRRVMGEYCLTGEDYDARADFYDAIAYYCYPIDIHGAKRDTLNANDAYHTRRYGRGECYGIPFRCLVPRATDNLLTAGRIISCDREMLGSLRVVPCCFATGQAAGTAAAIMASRKLHSGDVEARELRAILRADDCWLKNT